MANLERRTAYVLMGRQHSQVLPSRQPLRLLGFNRIARHLRRHSSLVHPALATRLHGSQAS